MKDAEIVVKRIPLFIVTQTEPASLVASYILEMPSKKSMLLNWHAINLEEIGEFNFQYDFVIVVGDHPLKEKKKRE